MSWPTVTAVDVIFFDVGGVLVDMSGQERRTMWANRLGVPVADMEQAVWDAVGFRDRSDLPEIQTRLADRLAVPPGEVEQFLQDFAAHWRRNDELVAYLSTFVDSHRLAIIGNIPSSGRFAFQTVLHLDEIFEAMFLSGELGIEKPDTKIYEIACAEMDVEPRAAVFVDDRADNVEAAIEFGMSAHRHTDNPTTIAWLRSQLQ